MKRFRAIFLVIVAIFAAQLACNAPVPIPLTGTGATITPVRIGTPGTPPAGTQTGADCTNKVTFINDVTFPDNTHVSAGQAFTKTWRVRNDGTCPWGPTGYPVSALVHTGGDPMGGPEEVPLAGVVQPGDTADISVPLTAPATPGSYVSQWMFKVNDSAGVTQTIGVGENGDGPLYVQIVVE
ncbi:MAG: hypothetical protein EHM21_17365 [Chloroflexi bacterium]|nr:MAG: hypothetical protein EHM21_17365 [Chloroflexota bacterium]